MSGFFFDEDRLWGNRFRIAPEPVCIRYVMLSLNADNRHTDFCRIIHCIFSPTFFTIEYRNNSDSVVDHPFISDLKTCPTIVYTDVFNEVC